RTRIITSPAFDADKILGAILFEQTMDSKIEGMYTADYLAKKKDIVPFLKVDKGLAEESNGVQLMKPINELNETVKRANERHMFGTTMRSVMKEVNPAAITAAGDQQFEIGKKIITAGLKPITETEVDTDGYGEEKCETLLKADILSHLNSMPEIENL